MSWTVRVRKPDLSLIDPIEVNQLKLVENYNLPDMLQLDNRLRNMIPEVAPGSGVMVHDDTGAFRFSGFLSKPERNGNGTGVLTYKGDLAYLWDRQCYPVPANAWSTAGQTAAYDVRIGSAESRLLQYIEANTGPTARTERRLAHIRLPTSLGRGPSAKTSARFQTLGVLACELAESMGFRLQMVQTFTGTTPYLDVKLTAVPDMSAYIRFGTAGASGPAFLSDDSRYSLEDPVGTVILSAAGGELADRILNTVQDTDRQALWGRRIESFQDQRGTTDATEITQGMVEALAAAAGLTEIALPVVSTPDFEIGTDVPLGAKVTAVIDGFVLVERIRQITTTIGGDGATKKVEAVFGSPEAGLTATQRQLAAALKRVSALERNL